MMFFNCRQFSKKILIWKAILTFRINFRAITSPPFIYTHTYMGLFSQMFSTISQQLLHGPSRNLSTLSDFCSGVHMQNPCLHSHKLLSQLQPTKFYKLQPNYYWYFSLLIFALPTLSIKLLQALGWKDLVNKEIWEMGLRKCIFLNENCIDYITADINHKEDEQVDTKHGGNYGKERG